MSTNPNKPKARKINRRTILWLGVPVVAVVFVIAYLALKGASPTSTSGDGTQAQSGGSGGGVPTAQQGLSQTSPVTRVSVVVAKGTLKPHTLLSAENIEVREIDAAAALPGALLDPSAVSGRVSLRLYAAGSQLTADGVGEPGFAHTLAADQLAFELPVGERNLFAGGLGPGDHVDVLWTGSLDYFDRVPTGDGKLNFRERVYTSTKSLTLLQGLPVLKVIVLHSSSSLGSTPAGPSSTTQTQASQAPGGNGYAEGRILTAEMFEDGAPYAGVLVLAVTEQQAEMLKFMRENGSIDLALRSADPADKKDPTLGISIDTLIEQGLVSPKANP